MKNNSLENRIEKYLIREATIGSDVSGDDDAPPGNILMGMKFKKKDVKTSIGSFKVSVPEDEWTWDEFEHAKGMEIKDNYHDSLKNDKVLKKSGMWKNIKSKKKSVLGLEKGDNKDGSNISAPQYVLDVLAHMEKRSVSKKNLPPIVFKIDKTLMGINKGEK